MESPLIFVWKKNGEDVTMPPLDEVPEEHVAWSENHVHAYVRVKPANSEVGRHPENMWTDDSGAIFELACVGPSGNCRWTFPASANTMRKMRPEIAEKFACRPWIETEPDGKGGRKPV